MKVVNNSNLSLEAKRLVDFFDTHKCFKHEIIVSSDGAILEPENLPFIENVDKTLLELKNNQYIISYNKEKVNDSKIIFSFKC